MLRVPVLMLSHCDYRRLCERRKDKPPLSSLCAGARDRTSAWRNFHAVNTSHAGKSALLVIITATVGDGIAAMPGQARFCPRARTLYLHRHSLQSEPGPQPSCPEAGGRNQHRAEGMALRLCETAFLSEPGRASARPCKRLHPASTRDGGPELAPAPETTRSSSRMAQAPDSDGSTPGYYRPTRTETIMPSR